MTEIVVTGERVTLDLILWRRFGAVDDAMLTAALELNPGLADLGPFIPIGREVKLPEFKTAAPESSAQVVSLFG